MSNFLMFLTVPLAEKKKETPPVLQSKTTHVNYGQGFKVVGASTAV